MDQDDFEMFKIVVIGDSATGKTNISLRFVQGEFIQAFKATVGVQFLNKVLTVQGTKVKVTFWDTAGQERYKSLSKVYYKGALGIIIVYDVTEQQTYVNIESWLKLANENLNIKDVVIMVLGNKIDKQDKKVPFEKVLEDYKQKFGIECFEVSAKTGEGIQESIMYLIEEIYKKNVESNDAPPEVEIMQDSNYETVVPRPASPPQRQNQKVTKVTNYSKSSEKQVAQQKPGKSASKPQRQTTKLTSNQKPAKKEGGCCG